jgi:hypothetical protein
MKLIAQMGGYYENRSLRDRQSGCELDSPDPRQDPVVGSCEHSKFHEKWEISSLAVSESFQTNIYIYSCITSISDNQT